MPGVLVLQIKIAVRQIVAYAIAQYMSCFSRNQCVSQSRSTLRKISVLEKIPVLERSLDFTFWFSISPELEQRTQEVIHKKYGGREKADKAARIIQESYRQYRLRQSFHKLR